MKKTVRITENELVTIIKKIVNEQSDLNMNSRPRGGSIDDIATELFKSEEEGCTGDVVSNLRNRGLNLITDENYSDFPGISDILDRYFRWTLSSGVACLFTNGNRLFTTVGFPKNDEGDYTVLEILPDGKNDSKIIKPKDMYSKEF